MVKMHSRRCRYTSPADGLDLLRGYTPPAYERVPAPCVMYGFRRSPHGPRHGLWLGQADCLEETVVDTARRNDRPPESVVNGRVEEQEIEYDARQTH
jgi:hypothetical protein